MLNNSSLEKATEGELIEDLPETFQHAIRVAKSVGINYIWIDALCVLVDPDNSHDEVAFEMARAHDIFNGACFVIAASRSGAQYDGFLHQRKSRDFLRFENNPYGTFYICEAIDDFDQDVLAGPMHQRAWAFQERVFARRTVFYGQKQMYFECGGGIRCETLSLIRK